MKLSAQLSTDNDDDEPILEKQKLNIPKSPSFHSGLDLVAGNNKYVNISKFNFANDMNGNNKASNVATSAEHHQQQSSQQTIFSFTKVRIVFFFFYCVI